MTTKDIAGSAVAKLLTGGTRHAVQPAAPGIFNWKWGRLGTWGTGKQGKTHLGLAARTSAIYELKVDGFTRKRGGLLLPSKPLTIAYANFDRPVASVADNLETDTLHQIVEEQLYRGNDGEILTPITMLRPDFEQLFQRFRTFAHEAEDAGIDLLFADGGTVVWEEVRRWKGIPPEDGVAPKEYQESNSEMRWRIMGMMETLKMHTLVSREAAEVWRSASAPSTDESGEVILKDDGWSRTSHRVDLDAQIRVRRDQATGAVIREAKIGTSLKALLIGRSIPDPTYAKLYQLNYGTPLIKREDIDEYQRVCADVEHIEAD